MRIPVSIIGGFLGAGKTTLVNHLIHNGNQHGGNQHGNQRGGKRFGVIVNEFGSLGIDGSLIENLDDGVAELANGCLCCVARDDVVEALVKLARQDPAPEHVLIELSGVADPVPAAQTLLEPLVRQVFTLESIIAVADARNLLDTVRNHPEGGLQLAYASNIVLNKHDIATPEQIDSAKEVINNVNPLATVHYVSHSQIDPAKVIGIDTFNDKLTDPSQFESAHVHTKGMTSFVLEADTPLDQDAFNDFIEDEIKARPGQVLRCKGWLNVQGFERAVLFQAVRDIVSVELGDDPPERSQLVVIGTNLDKDAFAKAFARATARPAKRR
jgi:G3E family GTPase